MSLMALAMIRFTLEVSSPNFVAVTGSTEDPARRGAGEVSIFQHRGSVDDDVFYTFGWQGRLSEGGSIADCIRIEDYDIRRQTGRQASSIERHDLIGGYGGHPMDRRLDGEYT